MYGPPKVGGRFGEKPHYCNVYGGNHPMAKYLSMKIQGGVRKNPYMEHWCDYH